MNGHLLVTDFVARLRSSDIHVSQTTVSKNVYQLSGEASCLLYVKAIAKGPHRWGVTANVVERLEDQGQPWLLVLLFDSSETGFLVAADAVADYVRTRWPLGADGDYKVSPGSYLEHYRPFNSFDEFLGRLRVSLLPSRKFTPPTLAQQRQELIGSGTIMLWFILGFIFFIIFIFNSSVEMWLIWLSIWLAIGAMGFGLQWLVGRNE